MTHSKSSDKTHSENPPKTFGETLSEISCETPRENLSKTPVSLSNFLSRVMPRVWPTALLKLLLRVMSRVWPTALLKFLLRVLPRVLPRVMLGVLPVSIGILCFSLADCKTLCEALGKILGETLSKMDFSVQLACRWYLNSL